NKFGKNLDFFIVAWPTWENDLEQLLKSEQPKRQPEIRRIDHQCVVAEAMLIFIVTVEQKNPHVWTHRQDLPQKECKTAGFAYAGAAENSEMFGNQVINVGARGDRCVLLKTTEFDRNRFVDLIDHLQLEHSHDECG